MIYADLAPEFGSSLQESTLMMLDDDGLDACTRGVLLMMGSTDAKVSVCACDLSSFPFAHLHSSDARMLRASLVLSRCLASCDAHECDGDFCRIQASESLFHA